MEEEYELIRKHLVCEVIRDLIGPEKVNEELTELPTSRYLTGILYPRETRIDAEEDQDSGEAADRDEGMDQGVVMATTTNPSAIGLTFTVATGTELQVMSNAAIYLQTPQEDGRHNLWRRQPLEIQPIQFNASGNDLKREALHSGLELMIRLRQRSDHHVVTLSLMNTLDSPESIVERAKHCFYQPGLTVRSITGQPVFMGRNLGSVEIEDPERRLNALLYRHVPEYGVGHGCAVKWTSADGEMATKLETALIPTYEIMQFSPKDDNPYPGLQMKLLGEAEADCLIQSLHELPSRYIAWINTLSLDDVPTPLYEVAGVNLDNCRVAADRISRGIELLARDKVALNAFQLANQAMLLQRERTLMMMRPENEEPNTEGKGPKWYPFQLAFILMCLPGIVDTEDESRSLVDLLWFPTGGGKTEAYLGLTAFTIFLRRLRNPGNSGAGVTVLMRYTLRLLTIQQFQRAAILIMACEKLRQNDQKHLGTDAISLGLWVGGGATPNRLTDAKRALAEIKEGDESREGSPFQIKKCPWCGNNISISDYRIESSMFIRCPNNDCGFDGDLPVYLVDDDIYTRKPTLLLGTVDKFARLPWLSEVTNLFGASHHLPPELIIQDELHLISGPLGSLVGLYEAAVDLLCTKDGIGPKVVASTATIRRAVEQSRALFNRDCFQFPPPALDARDSFFSRQIRRDRAPGRLYVGVHAPGRSAKTSLIRLYALLLQRILEHDADSRFRDPYWTMVGYFNSTRELGGALRLAADDIGKRMQFLAKRSGETERPLDTVTELYSQVPSNEIPEILEDMAKMMDQPGSIDVLLATNMLSVGVDVNRLGLMVVNGQPKLTAEYIQATSRVGRKYPGLVFTLYNWTRPRDRSHYERFTSYHSSIYSQVEPTSVTPFSSRARDRALHAVLVSLVRHTIAGMNPEAAAERFDPESSQVEELIDLLVARVAYIDPEEVDNTREQLQGIVRRWSFMTTVSDELYYGKRQKGALSLLDGAEQANVENTYSFPTLNSMREVEGEAGVSTSLMPRSRRF